MHDNAIAAERQKLQDILSQRRSAAMSARTARALTTAKQLLTKQSEVEQGFEQAKADMEKKLKTRISMQKHTSDNKNDAKTHYKPTLDSTAELAQFEECVGCSTLKEE
ncbi:unnamed protein product [Dibothriocephalus latus]|uniref:Uncharacterized protein n=1 Tax=Dibothriocephalus latus TaxID=60516 RepID=A0A3P7LR93_DIBLA|nr:unnamed protein product [Dibothriocephalus latus]